jgi:hypothetical protein
MAPFAWSRRESGWSRWAIARHSWVRGLVLHLYLYLILGRVLAPQGTNLPWMYVVWLLGLAILILPCWGYARLKHRSLHRSLLRLF